MSNDLPGYTYIGSRRWVSREQIPDSLLARYDRTFAAAEHHPSAIDPKTGSSLGALWMDVVDQILGQVGPLLDRDAVLHDQELRNRAEHRKLDAMLPRSATRP
jgi:hypothetical protein